MPPRKRPSAAEQEPLPIESPRKQGSSWSRCGPLQLCSPVSSALLTSFLFMPAQVLAPLQANNARSEGLIGKPSDDRYAQGRIPPCMAPHCHQSPGWRCAARVQEDEAQADGTFPAEAWGAQPAPRHRVFWATPPRGTAARLFLQPCRLPVHWMLPPYPHSRLVRLAWSQQRDQPVRGMMWCPVVPPRKPPQAPRSSQEASQPAASEPGPSTPLPAKRSTRTKAEPAGEPTKGAGKAQGKAAQNQASTTARKVTGQGLQCSAEHAAHWGEQVAATGAVLLARPGSSASQGQGVPWLGVQAAARPLTQGPAAAACCGTVVCAPPPT
ncbi:hypothetical protein HaLaN_09270 [Haematococcus lacustris]|uniref:Uncharacterized protein n=1 Tax=Haematococcus lacustris TaxID=44745 RepID=A0A699Z327_HAELA|nr:hypothetical protein HaLaN_09270 [Haematococcus lacustris]